MNANNMTITNPAAISREYSSHQGVSDCRAVSVVVLLVVSLVLGCDKSAVSSSPAEETSGRAKAPLKTRETKRPDQMSGVLGEVTVVRSEATAHSLRATLHSLAVEGYGSAKIIPITEGTSQTGYLAPKSLRNGRYANIQIMYFASAYGYGYGVTKRLLVVARREAIGPLPWVRKLDTLDLSYTKFQPKLVAQLKRLPNLRNLILRRAQLTDASLKSFSTLKQLSRLDVTDNRNATETVIRQLRSALPKCRITPTSQVHALNKLGANHTSNSNGQVTLASFVASKITDDDLPVVKKMTKLKTLIVAHSPITDAGLIHLKGLTSLQELHLGSTRITDHGLTHLKGLTSLQVLTLNDTRITDSGLAHLAGLTKLKSLSLLVTNVTAAGVKKLQAKLPNCKVSFSGRSR